MNVTQKRANRRVDHVVKFDQYTHTLIFTRTVPNQRMVQIVKICIPAVIVQPAQFAVNPHTNAVAERFASGVVFEPNIGEIKIVYQPISVDTNVQFTVAQNDWPSHRRHPGDRPSTGSECRAEHSYNTKMHHTVT